MGIGQVLTMPLFFPSNTIYPTAIVPGNETSNRSSKS
jgi:hypothetical protein